MQMIYNVVLTFTVPQSKSVIYISMYIFFSIFFSIIVNQETLNIATLLYNRTLLFILSVYNNSLHDHAVLLFITSGNS